MIVGVHPLAGFDKLLHYRVPEPLRATAGIGALVRVPVRASYHLGIVGTLGAEVALDQVVGDRPPVGGGSHSGGDPVVEGIADAQLAVTVRRRPAGLARGVRGDGDVGGLRRLIEFVAKAEFAFVEPEHVSPELRVGLIATEIGEPTLGEIRFDFESHVKFLPFAGQGKLLVGSPVVRLGAALDL